MIGDGHIQKTGRIILVSAYKDFFYSLFKFNNLKEIRTENSKMLISDYFDKRTNKIYTRTNIQTKTTKSILEKRMQWYPNGIKIIPKNIKIDEQLLSMLFLDDGYSTSCAANSMVIGICLNSFTYEDVEWINYKLFNEFGLLFKINKTEANNQYRLKGHTDCSLAMFCILKRFIEFYKIQSHKYKSMENKIFNNKELFNKYKEIEYCFNLNGNISIDLYKRINKEKYLLGYENFLKKV